MKRFKIKVKKIYQPLVLLNLSAGAVFLIGAAAVLANYPQLSDSIILHFQGGRGVDVTGPKFNLLLISGFSLALAAVNAWLSFLLIRRSKVLSYLLSAAALLAGVFFLIYIFQILSLN